MARTRAEDYEAKQAAILQGAASVFATLGMERASMAEIARVCSVSKPNLYHYYPSKNALLYEIIRKHLTELNEVTAAAEDPGLLPEARLEAVVIATLESYRDKEDFHQVQLSAMAQLSEEQRSELRGVERQITGRFARLLTEVNPALGDVPHLRMPVTMSLFGMLNWVYTWFQEDGALSREEYARLATQLFIKGFADLKL